MMSAPAALENLSREDARRLAATAAQQALDYVAALRRELEMARVRLATERDEQAKMDARAESFGDGTIERAEALHRAELHRVRALHTDQRVGSIEAALQEALGVERKGWWHSWAQRLQETQRRRQLGELERDVARAEARVGRESEAVAALRARVEAAQSEPEAQAWALQIPPAQARLEAALRQQEGLEAALAAAKKEAAR